MHQNFGRSCFSSWSRMGLIVQSAIVASALLLLTSCSFIQSREVTISPATAAEKESYYQDEAFSREGLSFESENFLRGNMEQDDLKENPEVTLHKLNVYYDISEDSKFLRIAADYCRWIAMESSDQELAVRAHLSALYYVRAAYAARMRTRGNASGYDFSDFRMMQIYNDSCRGIFSFLKSHKLLANNSFSLLDMEDRRYFFDAPHYHLSVPDDTVEDFTLCSDYSVNALMQKNRQPGVGIPLVGHVAQQEHFHVLKSPRGLTIPVTLVVGLRESDSHVMEVTMNYLDTSLEETAPKELEFLAAANWPLALDFSTPLACFLNSLPNRNLISVMVESDDQEDHSGLFLIEPYQPDKIPVVFIHGLMSSPDTWVQMINALKNDPVIRNGEYSELDNIITLTMDSMNYLLVEGTADLSNQEGNRYFLNIFKNENGSDDVVQLDNLAGSKDEVSWESSTVSEYVVEYSMDGFEHVLQHTTRGTAVDMLNLPDGTYQWRVKANMDNAEWNDGDTIISDNANATPKVFRSKADASDDIFFASPNGKWSSMYFAKHVGSFDDWTGTNDTVSAGGKGRIQDLFFGSADPSMLCLTDSENGDALFLDDAFTGLPEEIEENTGRLFRLQAIVAGAGDDIVDMTSQRFEYSDGNLSIFGGDGDDVIWASRGRNSLYGDAGNDCIVGASSDDLIIGGIGNDHMHGGGGDDIFTFCDNWGVDEVEQLASGKVTFWFTSELEGNVAWDEVSKSFTDGTNHITVKGFDADQVTLKFGKNNPEDTDLFTMLSDAGAFGQFTSQRIFEESKDLLA